jgi:hypothetical protein
MSRRVYQFQRWPETPLFETIAGKWCANHSFILVDSIWKACDAVRENELNSLPVEQSHEAKEESLNLFVAIRLQQQRSGYEPFAVVHQPPEQFARKSKNAQSPTPDIGFVWFENPNCVWPIEGKVLATPTDIGNYVKEMKNFLSGRYSTFSCEASLLGYLISGDPVDLINNIFNRLRKRQLLHPKIQDYHHRISKHARKTVAGRKKEDFYCHHQCFFVGNST